MTHAPTDPNARPTDVGVASTTPGGDGPHYPQDDTHTWGAFPLLAVEMGGYSDLEAVNPYTGARLWVTGPDAGHEYCAQRCGTCGLAVKQDGDALVHANASTAELADHPATENTDCVHLHGGKVGIMFNNQASNQYFAALRHRFVRWPRLADEGDVDIYEQLRRLVDVMEAEQFFGSEG